MPDNPKYLVFIANTYIFLNDIEQAVKYYRKAMIAAPKDNEIKLIYIETASKYIEEKAKDRK